MKILPKDRNVVRVFTVFCRLVDIQCALEINQIYCNPQFIHNYTNGGMDGVLQYVEGTISQTKYN